MPKIGTPSDTGLNGIRGRVTSAAWDYPYSEPRIGTDMNAGSHNPITPKDTEHTAWEELDEIMGSPIMLSKSSPGQMTGVTPGGHKFGNDPFDKEMDDDELSKAGRVSEEPDVNDDELASFIKAKRDSDAGAQFHGGSPFPSDIVVVAGGGEFTTGLGGAMKGSRGLPFGKMSYDVMPKRTVWDFLESYVIKNIEKKQ